MRGLGPQQLALLQLADRFMGVRVDYVSEMFSVTPRRARKLIQSCVEPGLVVVVNDPWTGKRRVFTPSAHRLWVFEQQLADERRETAKLFPGMRTARRDVTAR